jgi:uncharacterized protein YbjT (DUF2867 family)
VARIVLIGATGLIGGLVTRLGGDSVHGLVRRPSGRDGPETVAPPADWPRLVAGLGADVAVSALGTTRRAAGSEAAFRAVDFDMVLNFAKAARAAGIRRMVVVSSVGANSRSRAFYLRVKGEVEDALRALEFDRLDILRPSLLSGDRGSRRRFGDSVGILLSPMFNFILRGRLDRYTAIDAEIVARAILDLAGTEAPGAHIHHYRDLVRLGGRTISDVPRVA